MSLELSVAEREVYMFKKDNKVIRIFKGQAAEMIGHLDKVGIINELCQQGMIPPMKISKMDNEIRATQKLIKPLIYPFEWSPSQLREAGILTLNIQKFLEERGFHLKDAHPYNVVFDGCNPYFVDLGSIVKMNYGVGYWAAYPEFKASFEVPLKLAAREYTSIYSNTFLRQGSIINNYDQIYMARDFPFVSFKLYVVSYKIWMRYRSSFSWAEDRLNKRFNKFVSAALYSISRAPLPFRRVNYLKLISRFKKINFPFSTEWIDYHKQKKLLDRDGEKISPRFVRILDILQRLQPKSVLELAANEGVLSRAIKMTLNECKVISTDYDIGAIENNFKTSAQASPEIAVAKLDFMGDIFAQISSDREARLRSEVVIALAVTHHLALTQKYTFEAIFRKIYALSLDKVMIEFMPMGLWNGESAPEIPTWYNEIEFVKYFEKYFEISERIQLEDNRILFVGTKNDTIV